MKKKIANILVMALLIILISTKTYAHKITESIGITENGYLAYLINMEAIEDPYAPGTEQGRDVQLDFYRKWLIQQKEVTNLLQQIKVCFGEEITQEELEESIDNDKGIVRDIGSQTIEYSYANGKPTLKFKGGAITLDKTGDDEETYKSKIESALGITFEGNKATMSQAYITVTCGGDSTAPMFGIGEDEIEFGVFLTNNQKIAENISDKEGQGNVEERPNILTSLGETILNALLELFYNLGDVISSALNNWMNNKLPFYVMIDAAQYNQDTDVKSETALATNASEIVITKDAIKDNEIENEIVSDAQIPKLLATPEAILQNKVAVLQTNVLGDENNISDKIWKAIYNFTTEKFIGLTIISIAILGTIFEWRILKGMVFSKTGAAEKNAENQKGYMIWVMSFFKILLLALVILAVISLVNLITITVAGEYSNSIFPIKVTVDNGNSFNTNIGGLIRYQVQTENLLQKTFFTLAYFAYAILTGILFVEYFLRVIITAFQIVLAPIIVIKDAIKDETVGYNEWFKTLIATQGMQAVHGIMFFGIAYGDIVATAANPLFVLIILLVMDAIPILLVKKLGIGVFIPIAPLVGTNKITETSAARMAGNVGSAAFSGAKFVAGTTAAGARLIGGVAGNVAGVAGNVVGNAASNVAGVAKDFAGQKIKTIKDFAAGKISEDIYSKDLTGFFERDDNDSQKEGMEFAQEGDVLRGRLKNQLKNTPTKLQKGTRAFAKAGTMAAVVAASKLKGKSTISAIKEATKAGEKFDERNARVDERKEFKENVKEHGEHAAYGMQRIKDFRKNEKLTSEIENQFGKDGVKRAENMLGSVALKGDGALKTALAYSDKLTKDKINDKNKQYEKGFKGSNKLDLRIEAINNKFKENLGAMTRFDKQYGLEKMAKENKKAELDAIDKSQILSKTQKYDKKREIIEAETKRLRNEQIGKLAKDDKWINSEEGKKILGKDGQQSLLQQFQDIDKTSEKEKALHIEKMRAKDKDLIKIYNDMDDETKKKFMKENGEIDFKKLSAEWERRTMNESDLQAAGLVKLSGELAKKGDINAQKEFIENYQDEELKPILEQALETREYAPDKLQANVNSNVAVLPNNDNRLNTTLVAEPKEVILSGDEQLRAQNMLGSVELKDNIAIKTALAYSDKLATDKIKEKNKEYEAGYDGPENIDLRMEALNKLIQDNVDIASTFTRHLGIEEKVKENIRNEIEAIDKLNLGDKDEIVRRKADIVIQERKRIIQELGQEKIRELAENDDWIDSSLGEKLFSGNAEERNKVIPTLLVNDRRLQLMRDFKEADKKAEEAKNLYIAQQREADLKEMFNKMTPEDQKKFVDANAQIDFSKLSGEWKKQILLESDIQAAGLVKLSEELAQKGDIEAQRSFIDNYKEEDYRQILEQALETREYAPEMLERVEPRAQQPNTIPTHTEVQETVVPEINEKIIREPNTIPTHTEVQATVVPEINVQRVQGEIPVQEGRNSSVTISEEMLAKQREMVESKVKEMMSDMMKDNSLLDKDKITEEAINNVREHLNIIGSQVDGLSAEIIQQRYSEDIASEIEKITKQNLQQLLQNRDTLEGIAGSDDFKNALRERLLQDKDTLKSIVQNEDFVKAIGENKDIAEVISKNPEAFDKSFVEAIMGTEQATRMVDQRVQKENKKNRKRQEGTNTNKEENEKTVEERPKIVTVESEHNTTRKVVETGNTIENKNTKGSVASKDNVIQMQVGPNGRIRPEESSKTGAKATTSDAGKRRSRRTNKKEGA